MSIQQAPCLSPAEIATKLLSTNDSIARGASRFRRERMNFEFFCECGDSRCHEGVWLTVAEYRVRGSEAIVAHPTL
jgi:hypothetical protein